MFASLPLGSQIATVMQSLGVRPTVSAASSAVSVSAPSVDQVTFGAQQRVTPKQVAFSGCCG
jgi:hypothetical protein